MTCRSVIKGATFATRALTIPLSLSAVIWQHTSPLLAADQLATPFAKLGTGSAPDITKLLSALILSSASASVVLPGIMPWKHGVGYNGSSFAIRLVSYRYSFARRGGAIGVAVDV